MSWLDWVLICIIVLSLLNGIRHGLIRTFLGTLKYLVSFVLILFFGPQLGEFLIRPWNLTQVFAASISDMMNLPGTFYTAPIQISQLSERIQQGDFPIEEFSNSLQYIISHLELPHTLRDILNSLFNHESIIEYLLRVSPDFTGYPIDNMEELVFYTLGSFIAKLIAISIGALVIIIVVFLITQFFISVFHKISTQDPMINLTNRLLGGLFNSGICILVLILVLELITPLLCYFMIDPNQSVLFSAVMESSFHIRPWLEQALLNM